MIHTTIEVRRSDIQRLSFRFLNVREPLMAAEISKKSQQATGTHTADGQVFVIAVLAHGRKGDRAHGYGRRRAASTHSGKDRTNNDSADSQPPRNGPDQ